MNKYGWIYSLRASPGQAPRLAAVEEVENFTAINRQRFLIIVEGVIDARLNRSIYRVGTAVRPVVSFTGIQKLDTRDVLDILVPVFKWRNQSQRVTMIFAQRLSVHTQNKQHTWTQ